MTKRKNSKITDAEWENFLNGPPPKAAPAVGYRQPPVRHQFPKGVSGNCGGRPKGTKNIKTDFLEEFQQKIKVREGDLETSISKQRATLKSMIARGIKGDQRAANKALDLAMKIATEDEKQPKSKDLPEEDLAIIVQFIQSRTIREL